MDQSLEEWRPVVGYEGLYEVSSHGRVRSLDRWIRHRLSGKCLRHGAQLRPAPVGGGYLALILHKDGTRKQRKVHILVAEAFLESRPQWSTMVNHKNKVVTDNSVQNLEWSDNSHNQRHARAKYFYLGALRSCSELAEIAGIAQHTMYARLNTLGWSIEKAITTPLQNNNAKRTIASQSIPVD